MLPQTGFLKIINIYFENINQSFERLFERNGSSRSSSLQRAMNPISTSDRKWQQEELLCFLYLAEQHEKLKKLKQYVWLLQMKSVKDFKIKSTYVHYMSM